MILRFEMKDGVFQDFPYDFDESASRRLAIDQFWGLFKHDVCDIKLLNGWAVNDRKSYLERTSNSDRRRWKDQVISALKEYDFFGKDAAMSLGISERTLVYWINQFNLNWWVERSRREVRDRRNQFTTMKKAIADELSLFNDAETR